MDSDGVVQPALAAILALARRRPRVLQGQRRRHSAPLAGAQLQRDLAGQTALVVGWGSIGQGIAAVLRAVGGRIAVARNGIAPAGYGVETVPYEQIDRLLSGADWLILACPLTSRTQGLVRAAARLARGGSAPGQCAARGPSR